MFEGAIAALLTKYLGAFVTGFKASDVHVGRDVALTNVELRRDALASLGLPIEVRKGFIGRLHVKIPWLSILSRAVVVTLEDLSVVAGPSVDISQPPEDPAAALAAKLAAVQALEAKREGEAAEESGPGFGARLATKVIDNLQVVIRNVHIRFEDRSVSTEPTAVGVRLEYLRAETTDEAWNPAYLEVDLARNPLLFKLAEIRGLAIYADPITDADATPQEHQHVLAPLSAQLKLVICKRDDYAVERPRIEATLVIDSVGLGLRERQLRALLRLAEFFTVAAACKRFRQTRPRLSPLVDPAAWWRWAAQCVIGDVAERVRRLSFQYVLKRRQLRTEYVALHRQRLAGHALKGGDAAAMEDLERQLSVDDIVFFRALAAAEHKALLAREKAAQSGKGFFSRWFGGRSEPAAGPVQMTDRERDELYASVTYGSDGAAARDDPKRVKLRLSFTLQRGSVDLASDAAPLPILCAGWNSITVSIDARGDGMLLRSTVGSMLVEDPRAEHALYRALAAPAAGSTLPLLDVRLDTTEEKEPGATVVWVQAQPLDLVVSAPALARVAAFAGSARPQGLHALEATALAQLDALRQATTRGLSSALRSRKRMVVSANLAGPAILVPETFTSTGSRALIVRLADVRVGSKRADSATAAAAGDTVAAGADGGGAVGTAAAVVGAGGGGAGGSATRAEDEALYDRFDVQLSGLSVVCGRADPAWRRSSGGDDAVHLVEEFGLNLVLESCAIVHVSHPRLRVRARLPSVRVDAAYEKLSHAIAVANSWVNTYARASPPPAPSAVLQGPVETPELEGAAAIAVAAARVEREQAQAVASRESVLRSWDTVGSDRSASRVQQLAAATLLDAQFTLAEVSVVVSREGRELFAASVLGLSAGIEQRQFDRRLRVSLGGVVLRDAADAPPDHARLLYAGTGGGEQGAHTPDSVALLSAVIEQVDEAAPDFVGMNRPLTRITAQVEPITVVVQPKVLGSMLSLANDIGQLWVPVTPAPAAPAPTPVGAVPRVPGASPLVGPSARLGSAPTAPASPAMTGGVPPAAGAASRRAPPPAGKGASKKVDWERVELSLQANAAALRVELFTTEWKPLARAEIAGAAANVKMKRMFMHVDASLNRVELVSLLDGDSAPVVMAREQGALVQVAFESRDRAHPAFQVDSFVQAKVGGLRAVVRAPFVAALMKYGSSFPMAQSIKTGAAAASSAAADAVARRAREVQQMLQLDVDMTAPLIELADEEGRVALSVDLGQLTARNEFRAGVEELDVRLQRTAIDAAAEPLLADMDVHVRVRRPFGPDAGSRPLEVGVTVPKVGLGTSQRQLLRTLDTCKYVMAVIAPAPSSIAPPAATAGTAPTAGDAALSAVRTGGGAVSAAPRGAASMPTLSLTAEAATAGSGATPAAPLTAPPDKQQPLSASVSVLDLTVALRAPDSSSLTEFQIGGLGASLHRTATGGMEVTAKMVSLLLLDTRPETPAFRAAVSMNGTPESPPLHVSLVQAPGEPTKVEALLRQPRVVLAASLVRAIQDFTTPVTAALATLRPSAPSTPSPSPSALSTPDAGAGAPALSGSGSGSLVGAGATAAEEPAPVLRSMDELAEVPGTKIRASLIGASVVLPGDPRDESAGAFVLGFGLNLDMYTSPAKLTVMARVKELSLAAASVLSTPGGSPVDGPDALLILKPSEVEVDLNQKNASLEQPKVQRIIHVFLRSSEVVERGQPAPPIGAVFSYQNYKMLMGVLDWVRRDLGLTSKPAAVPDSAASPALPATPTSPTPPTIALTPESAEAAAARTVEVLPSGVAAAAGAAVVPPTVPSAGVPTAPLELPPLDTLPLSPVPIGSGGGLASVPSTPAHVMPPVRPPPAAHDEIDVEVLGLQLVVMDDCEGRSTPLLVADLSNVRAHLEDAGAQAKVTLTGAVDYYNDGAAAWEPLLEPWTAEANVQREESGTTVVEIGAPRKLDLTLTHACVSILLGVARTWSADLTRKGPPPAPFAPFVLHNTTGVPVGVAVPECRVDDLLLVPDSVSPIGSGMRQRGAVRRPLVRASFAVHSCVPVEGIRIDKVGMHVLPLQAGGRTAGPTATAAAAGATAAAAAAPAESADAASVSRPPSTPRIAGGSAAAAPAPPPPPPLQQQTSRDALRAASRAAASLVAGAGRALGAERAPLRPVLVADIAVRNGVKHVTLRSRVSVRNRTTLPLQLRVMPRSQVAAGPAGGAGAQAALDTAALASEPIAGWETKAVTASIAPSTESDVPLPLALDGILDLRADVAGSSYGPPLALGKLVYGTRVYSTGACYFSVVVKPAGEREISGDPLVMDPVGAAATAASPAAAAAAGAGTAAGPSPLGALAGKPVPLDAAIDIVVYPTLVVENLCAAPLSFRVSNPDVMGLMVEETVPMGGRAQVYRLDGTSPRTLLSLCTAATGFSVPVSITQEKVALPGGSGTSDLQLLLDTRQEHGGRAVAVYAPYWIVNRTGLPLVFRPPGEGLVPNQTAPEHLRDQALMFSRDSTQVSLPGAAAAWSKSFPINSVGSVGVADVPSQRGVLALGYSVALASGVFRRTKVVTVTPRHVVLNHLRRPLMVAQQGAEKEAVTVPAGGQAVWHWPDTKAPRKVRLRLGDDQMEWCAALPLDNALDAAMYLRRTGGAPAAVVRVEVRPENAITYIVLLPEDAHYPTYRVANASSVSISVSQKGQPFMLDLPPKTTAVFAWDEPLSERVVLVRLGERGAYSGSAHKEVHLDRLARSKPIALPSGLVGVEVQAAGPTRLLRVTDRLPRVSAAPIPAAAGAPVAAAAAAAAAAGPAPASPGSATAGGDGDEDEEFGVDEPEVDELQVRAKLAGIGLSVVDGARELVYASMENLSLDLRCSPSLDKVKLVAGLVQLDNPAADAAYPVVLSATPVKTTPPPPFLQVALTRRRVAALDFIPYFSLLLQAMDLKADTNLILALVDFAQRLPFGGDEVTDPLPPAPTPPAGGTQRIYVQELELQPIVVHITFSLGSILNSHTDNPVFIVLRAIGVTVANLDNAELSLSALLLRHPFMSRAALMARIRRFYVTAALRELWKLIGSADILGDPVGLFTDLGTGVKELFYEPAQGLVAGPEDFALGMARGLRSLLTHTVHGVFSTTSKLTGAVGSGIVRLSADDEFIAEREAHRRAAPRHVGDGLVQGAVGMGRGLLDGITGIVMQPVKGAQREGGLGLLKGIGRGLVGVVVKPVTGVLDFGTKTMEGIKNTATLGNAVTTRRRPPRVFGPEGELARYELAIADGLQLLQAATAKRSVFAGDQYQWHQNLRGRAVLLLTDKHLLRMKRQPGGAPELRWAVALWHIEEVSLRELQVVFKVAEVARHAFQMGNERVAEALTPHDAATIHARVVRAVEPARRAAQAGGYLGKPDPAEDVVL